VSLLHENTAFSSGDSRQEDYNSNYGIQSDIVSDGIPASVKEVSSGDSRQDFNIFTDKCKKEGKTALLSANSSGDSRHDCFIQTV
jgi:hypothetical protein